MFFAFILLFFTCQFIRNIGDRCWHSPIAIIYVKWNQLISMHSFAHNNRFSLITSNNYYYCYKLASIRPKNFNHNIVFIIFFYICLFLSKNYPQHNNMNIMKMFCQNIIQCFLVSLSYTFSLFTQKGKKKNQSNNNFPDKNK